MLKSKPSFVYPYLCKSVKHIWFLLLHFQQKHLLDTRLLADRVDAGWAHLPVIERGTSVFYVPIHFCAAVPRREAWNIGKESEPEKGY